MRMPNQHRRFGLAGRLIVVLIALGLVVGAGAIALAKKKVPNALTVDLGAEDPETKEVYEEVYPSELIVGDGDVVRFVNKTENKVLIEILTADLFVNPDDDKLYQKGDTIILEPKGSKFVLINEKASTVFNEDVPVYYGVDFDYQEAAKMIDSRPRIIVNPSD